MKIELTNEQYRTLVEMVAFAHGTLDEILPTIDNDEDEERIVKRHEAYNSLQDYLVGHAPFFDALDIVQNKEGLLELNEDFYTLNYETRNPHISFPPQTLSLGVSHGQSLIFFTNNLW